MTCSPAKLLRTPFFPVTMKLLKFQMTSVLLAIAAIHSGAVRAADPAGPLPGRIRLALPPALYAVEGQETNVYFDNVVLTTRPQQYAFDAICDRGSQQEERWTWTPKKGEAGRYPFQIEVRDEENALIARAETALIVTAADTGADRPLSVLMIGDSLTHASVYPAHVLELCRPEGNPKISLVGSFQPAGVAENVRHEGYGGWTAKRFATHFTETARQGDYAKRGSPFLYADDKGNKQLDFKRYCREVNGGKSPEIVSIFLGPNDVFGATDETIEAVTDGMLQHYDQLIDMIHAASPKAQIAVMLPVPPAASQDAFGSNYAAGQTRWQYKRNQHRLVERMLERYPGREAAAIHIVPTYANLDCRHNYPASAAPWNARTAEQGERQVNGVHPAGPGYQQIGDTLYAWLKYQAAR